MTECEVTNPIFIDCRRENDAVNDPTVKTVIVEQTKQWSEMMAKHHKEELDLMKQQLQIQLDILKNLMEIAQAQQFKDLEAIFDR